VTAAQKCPDCQVVRGQIHTRACPHWSTCPLCGWQTEYHGAVIVAKICQTHPKQHEELVKAKRLANLPGTPEGAWAVGMNWCEMCQVPAEHPTHINLNKTMPHTTVPPPAYEEWPEDARPGIVLDKVKDLTTELTWLEVRHLKLTFTFEVTLDGQDAFWESDEGEFNGITIAGIRDLIREYWGTRPYDVMVELRGSGDTESLTVEGVEILS
jgi:hypothetical protein